MVFEIRDAARSNAKPLIGIQSESGAGKTYSALLLARGFVGPSGKIGMIETESGRGEAYADVREYPEIGGYKVISMRGDFSPKNYGDAISAFEAAKIDALIIDSASHEWAGAGGVLDMASKREADGKKGMLIWQQPKIDHQKHFMLRFMQTPIPLVILNMRAKYPMIVQKGKDPVRSTTLEPIQAEDILFEMFVHGWIGKEDHAFHPTKITAKGLREVFVDGMPITHETGRKLAVWAAGTKPEDQTAPETRPLHVIKAQYVAKKIREAKDAADLYDIMAIECAEDIADVAAASAETHKWLMDQHAARAAAFSEGGQ